MFIDIIGDMIGGIFDNLDLPDLFAEAEIPDGLDDIEVLDLDGMEVPEAVDDINLAGEMENLDGEVGVDAEIETADCAEAITDDAGLDSEDVIRVEPRDGILPRNGGEWLGEEGNSEWVPDSDYIPGDRHGTNPENKSWAEIKTDYGFDKIAFIDGEPDFSPLSKGTVDITDFTEDRECNFAQADELLAAQNGTGPEEIERWRHENKYTWHECANCKTMQLVPTEVHGNLSHSGGISAIKQMKIA